MSQLEVLEFEVEGEWFPATGRLLEAAAGELDDDAPGDDDDLVARTDALRLAGVAANNARLDEKLDEPLAADGGPRWHWAHPTEHVPACMVAGTAELRDVECRATRKPGDVTCVECKALLPWRSVAIEVAQAIGSAPQVQRQYLPGDDLGELIEVIRARLEVEMTRRERAAADEPSEPHLHTLQPGPDGTAQACCSAHDEPAVPACGSIAPALIPGGGPVARCGKPAGHTLAGDRDHQERPGDPEQTFTWRAQPWRADGKLVRTRHDLGNGGDIVAMMASEGMAGALVDLWNRYA